MTRREAMALVAWYGLEWMTSRSPSCGVALAKLAPLMDGRAAGGPVTYGPTPNPRFSPWLATLPDDQREALWDRAVTGAYGMLAVGPVESRRRQRLHAELIRYLASVDLRVGRSDLSQGTGLCDRGHVRRAVA